MLTIQMVTLCKKPNQVMFFYGSCLVVKSAVDKMMKRLFALVTLVLLN